MVSGILPYGFAAVLLGGIDNPWGAPLGGFFVGVLENIAGATELKLTVGPGNHRRSPGFKTRRQSGMSRRRLKQRGKAASRSPPPCDPDYSEASSLSFGGRRTNFPSTGKAVRSALYPLPLFVGQAAPILVKYDLLLLPSRTTKISNAGLLFVVIFSFIYSGVIAGFMRERKPGYFAARQDENSGAQRMERARICGL